MNYELLKWDSDFFGFGVARITTTELTSQKLCEYLTELKKQNIRLVYWATTQIQNFDDLNCATIQLVDQKLRFTHSCRPAGANIAHETVKAHTEKKGSAELKNLALQSGAFSRFAVDPLFPKETFYALYETWMAKSCSGELADAVLTIKKEGKNVGCITLRAQKQRSKIGLLAVDKQSRGMGLGNALLRAAEAWSLQRDCQHIDVVTQADNTPACKLYSKYGFTLTKRDYVYHLWL